MSRQKCTQIKGLNAMNPLVLEGIRVILHCRILDLYRVDTDPLSPVVYFREWCEVVEMWVDERQLPANNRAQTEDLRRFLFGELSKSANVNAAWIKWRTHAITELSEASQARMSRKI